VTPPPAKSSSNVRSDERNADIKAGKVEHIESGVCDERAFGSAREMTAVGEPSPEGFDGALCAFGPAVGTDVFEDSKLAAGTKDTAEFVGDGGWIVDAAQHQARDGRVDRIVRKRKRFAGCVEQPNGEIKGSRALPCSLAHVWVRLHGDDREVGVESCQVGEGRSSAGPEIEHRAGESVDQRATVWCQSRLERAACHWIVREREEAIENSHAAS